MRYKRYISIIIYFTLLYITLIVAVIPLVFSLMIPVPFYDQPILIIMNILITSFIIIIIEFGVVYAFLKSRKLFVSVVLVNLVMFPPVGIISYFFFAFYSEFALLYVLIIIPLMTLIECFLYYLEFQNLFYRNSIKNQPNLKRSSLISLIANLASYSMLFFYPTNFMSTYYF